MSDMYAIWSHVEQAITAVREQKLALAVLNDGYMTPLEVAHAQVALEEMEADR